MARTEPAVPLLRAEHAAALPPESPDFRPVSSRSTSGSWLVTFARRGSRKPEYWLKARKAVRMVPPSRRKAEQLAAALEYRTTVALEEYFAGVPEFSDSIPRPVQYVAECEGIVSEYRGGRHLKDALFMFGNVIGARLRPHALDTAAENCGRWLRHLHEMPIPDWLPAHPMSGESLRLRAEEAVSLLRPQVRELLPLTQLFAWTEELREGSGPLAVSHGDFQPGNVLTSGSGISVIDLGTAGVRPPEDDLGFFITFANTYKERIAFGRAAGTRSFVRNFCRAFLRGYAADAGEMTTRLRPYIAWLITRRIADMSMRIENRHPLVRAPLRARLVSWVRSELPLFLREFD